jgi:hypothetical protein
VRLESATDRPKCKPTKSEQNGPRLMSLKIFNWNETRDGTIIPKCKTI